MVGKTKSVFTLVQRLGFFWRHQDSGQLSAFLDGFDEKRVRAAARHHVLVLTQLLDGSYSAYGLRMVEALGIKSLGEVWDYRAYLMERFDIPLSQKYPKKVWLQSDTPGEFLLARIVREYNATRNLRKQRIAGIVVGDYSLDHSLAGSERKD